MIFEYHRASDCRVLATEYGNGTGNAVSTTAYDVDGKPKCTRDPNGNRVFYSYWDSTRTAASNAAPPPRASVSTSGAINSQVSVPLPNMAARGEHRMFRILTTMLNTHHTACSCFQ